MPISPLGFQRIKVIALAVTDRSRAEQFIVDPVQAYDDGFYVGSLLDSEGNKLWFCSPVEAAR